MKEDKKRRRRRRNEGGAREIKGKELDVRARGLLGEDAWKKNLGERDVRVGRSELRPMVGAKEAVTKECENEDFCVGEREKGSCGGCQHPDGTF